MNKSPRLMDTDEAGRSFSAITLRDIFAGLAMHALISMPDDQLPEGCRKGESVSSYAYGYADAMLEARGKQQ